MKLIGDVTSRGWAKGGGMHCLVPLRGEPVIGCAAWHTKLDFRESREH